MLSELYLNVTIRDRLCMSSIANKLHKSFACVLMRSLNFVTVFLWTFLFLQTGNVFATLVRAFCRVSSKNIESPEKPNNKQGVGCP